MKRPSTLPFWLFKICFVLSFLTTGHSQDAESALTQQLGHFLSASPIAEDRKQKMTTMVLAAYKANKFQPLWGAYTRLEDVPVYEQIIKNHGLKPQDLKLLIPSRKKVKGAGSAAFSIEELYKTLWLAEVCLLLREGTTELSQKSRWANWTMGDEPGAVSLASPSFINQMSDTFAKAIISGVTLTSRLEKNFAPQNPVYRQLQKHYSTLFGPTPPKIQQGSVGGFSKGPTLYIEKEIKAGDRFFRAKELANYLYQLGFMSEQELRSISVIYSKELQEAMAKFQKSRNLIADGILEPETAKVIAEGSKPVPVKEQPVEPVSVDQSKLLLNLNRARQLPHNMGSRYIVINLPSAELIAFQGSQVAHQTKVLIGAPAIGKQTPVLKSQIETVVLNPYWLLSPNSAYEKLPRIRENYWYLKNNGFQIVDRSGKEHEYNKDNLDRIQSGELFLRQPAGKNNTLGSTLLRFPNFRYIDCYVTTWAEPLNKDNRATTNGRIAIAQNHQLTSWLLSQNDEEWNEAKLTHTIQNGGKENEIKLSSPVPIYIIYLTAIPGESEPTILPDIYNLDRL